MFSKCVSSLWKSHGHSKNFYRVLVSQYSSKNNESNRKQDKNLSTKVVAASAVAGLLGYYLYVNKNEILVFAAKTRQVQHSVAGQFRADLPSYSLDQLNQHTTRENKIWVSYREGIYDITEFVDGHPGGDQILIAAGSSVEPFWLLYGIHENDHVFEVLETLRIGNLKKEDQIKQTENMDDPYAREPMRHPILKPASRKPFNAETPSVLLCDNFLTPNDYFYVRNHLPVPDIDPNAYELEIEVEGTKKTLTFTLEQLRKLPRHTITATIMCAGNRRTEMTKIKPVKGLNWGIAAIGNATWTGVKLRDILKMVGITEDEEKYKHVHFEGMDFDATSTTYAASIPIWKAVDRKGDVILAYEMNGVPIPKDHGFPVRVIVPGVAGARNVKWLGKVVVSETESTCHWQQNDYKGFCPSTDWDTVDFTKSPAIQELPVISAICKPGEGETIKVEDGYINVKGYAWSGGGQKIVRVDVTIDNGKTWHVAEIDHQDKTEPPRHWAWTLWSIKIPVDQTVKQAEIWAKAIDSHYNTQPENFENIWNLRGVLSNAYHRVKVNLSH